MRKNVPKTLIGVFASHDDPDVNQSLADFFRDMYSPLNDTKKLLKKFSFVFTDGTYKRLFNGVPCHGQDAAAVKHHLSSDLSKYLHKNCGIIRLPTTFDGGVILLANLITQRKLSIIWPFLSPITTHLLFPVNLATLRLADQWHVKKLMNKRSVEEWFLFEAEKDAKLNRLEIPFDIINNGSDIVSRYDLAVEKANSNSIENGIYNEQNDFIKQTAQPVKLKVQKDLNTTNFGQMVVALISHDEMKNRMLDFVIDYEHELSQFKSIIATGTTGKMIEEVSPLLKNKVHRYHSGPKGGDIEIATEILHGGCHLVIFFVDPLHSHPHIEDIRVLYGACTINQEVRILSNEAQARDWMNRFIRGTA